MTESDDLTLERASGFMGVPFSVKEPAPRTTPDPGDSDAEPPDTEAPYGYTASGRVRKRPVKTTGSTGGRSSRNTAKAEEAAAVLCKLNDMLCIGLMLGGFPNTASDIASGEDTFKSQAVAALEADPKLCDAILRSGARGGKVALMTAYGLLFAGAFQSGSAEMAAKMQARKAKAVTE